MLVANQRMLRMFRSMDHSKSKLQSERSSAIRGQRSGTGGSKEAPSDYETMQ